MRYLSIDIEATGLQDDCLMIELGMVPFDGKTLTLENSLTFHSYIQCPSFEELRPKLDPWVIRHNKELIQKAHTQGVTLTVLKEKLTAYFESLEVKSYFKEYPLILFGKSLSAIDLPFLKRDLGNEFMQKYFKHRQLDFSSVCYSWIDAGLLSPGDESGTQLMRKLGYGAVAHTALEDAQNTVKMYTTLLERFRQKIPEENLKLF